MDAKLHLANFDDPTLIGILEDLEVRIPTGRVVYGVGFGTIIGYFEATELPEAYRDDVRKICTERIGEPLRDLNEKVKTYLKAIGMINDASEGQLFNITPEDSVFYKKEQIERWSVPVNYFAKFSEGKPPNGDVLRVYCAL